MIVIGRAGFSARHPVGFQVLHDKPIDEYELLLIHSKAYFQFEKEEYDTEPNTFIILEKGMTLEYHGREEPYMDDWIRFDLTEQDGSLLERLSLPVNRPVLLPQMNSLEGLVRGLVLERFSDEIHREETMACMMKAILYRLSSMQAESRDERIGSPYYVELCRVRLEIRNFAGDTNVDRLAAGLNLSTSYFQHLYKKYFGISYIQEVIAARLEKAEYELSTSYATVEHIAEGLGYASTQHFIRQFKKYTGMTPKQYRKNNILLPETAKRMADE